MYRAAIAVRPLARASVVRASPMAMARFAQPIAVRSYAAAAGLSKDQISERVLEVMKTFEKVDGGKVGLCVMLCDGDRSTRIAGKVGRIGEEENRLKLFAQAMATVMAMECLWTMDV